MIIFPLEITFGIFSIALVLLSGQSLFHPKSHGFYRFFSWECILWLSISNLNFWFVDPFSAAQIFSWILLVIALYLVITGVILLKKRGKPNLGRDEKLLFHFEKTSELIDTGIYSYIRHPLYASLLCLTWGIFLKQTTAPLLFVALLSTFFLLLTALFDEKECLIFFGDKYKVYMSHTKRFIPFLF